MGIDYSLSAEEIRVMGCLLEKAVTTPDQYPLTLNALTLACNQKSSREPVMSLEPGIVATTAHALQDKHLIRVVEGRNGVDKYTQRLCNTLMANYKFDPPQYAVLCVLLLRGPQTPGELRTRTARLHAFADNEEVKATLEALMNHEQGPVIARLPRPSGRMDHTYCHLFAGQLSSVAEETTIAERSHTESRRVDKIAQLEARLNRLEQAVTDLATRLGEQVDLNRGA